MKRVIIIGLCFLSGLVFADDNEFLPQCHIKSENPYFQPDITKDFFLARNSQNQTIQYCNEASLLKDEPWVDYHGNQVQNTESLQLTRFKVLAIPVVNVGGYVDFHTCEVSFNSASDWQIGDCKKESEIKGLAKLAANP